MTVNTQDNQQERMLALLEELFGWSLQVLQVPVLFGVKPNSHRIQLHRIPEGVGIPIYVPRGYHTKLLRYEKELKTMAMRFFPDYIPELQQAPPVLYLKQKAIKSQSFTFKFNQDKPFISIIGVEPKGKVIPKLPLNHPEYAHMLVAGASGSGKTNTVQALILSACFNTSPEDLRVFLLDPKFTGLDKLARLPHVETFSYEMEEISRILVQLKEELLDRRPTRRKHPYIWVVIEELAEVTTDPLYGKILKDEILPTLGRLGREFDVRLLVGIQKPTADIMGSQLRQQFSLRFIGRLESDRESSWLIEDPNISAKKLPGKGLLYYKVGPMDYELIQVARVKDIDLLVDEIVNKWTDVPVVRGLLPELTEDKIEEAEVVTAKVSDLKRRVEAHRAKWIKDGQLTVNVTAACAALGVNVKNRDRRLEVKELLNQLLEEATDE